MVRVNFCVNKSRSKECSKIVNECHGILRPHDPQKDVTSEYEFHSVNFNNLNDANAFIYSGYSSFGLYFYIVSMLELSLKS